MAIKIVAAIVTFLIVALGFIWMKFGLEAMILALGGIVGSMASTLLVMKVGSIRVYYVQNPPGENSVKIINPDETRMTRKD